MLKKVEGIEVSPYYNDLVFILKTTPISDSKLEEIFDLYDLCSTKVYNKIKRNSGEIYTFHIDDMIKLYVGDGFYNPDVIKRIIAHDFIEEGRDKLGFSESSLYDMLKKKRYISEKDLFQFEILTQDPLIFKEKQLERILKYGDIETLACKVYDISQNCMDPQNIKPFGRRKKINQAEMLMRHLKYLDNEFINKRLGRIDSKNILLRRLENSINDITLYELRERNIKFY